MLCGDITFIWTGACWNYTAVVINLFTPRVLGYAMSPRSVPELAAHALDMAYGMRGKSKGVMFHSYSARKFRQCSWRYQMTQRVCRRGNC
jgi:putative transposase